MQRMAIGKVHLNFQGYWRDQHRMDVPDATGIYCVYRCEFDPRLQTVRPIELLAVEPAANARLSLSGNPGRADWKRRLQIGEVLCVTFAPIVLQRESAAGVLRALSLTPARETDAEEAPGGEIELLLSGKIRFLKSESVTAWESEPDVIPFRAHQRTGFSGRPPEMRSTGIRSAGLRTAEFSSDLRTDLGNQSDNLLGA